MPLIDKIKIIPRRLFIDDRGWFLKVIDGKEDGLPNYTGEVYLTNSKPGEAKGGHYHEKANEWFTLVTGECKLQIVDIDSGEKLTIYLSSEKPETIFIPSNVAHIFINISTKDYILLAYSDQLFDPKDTVNFSSF